MLFAFSNLNSTISSSNSSQYSKSSKTSGSSKSEGLFLNNNLIQINLNNLSASQSILTFPTGTQIFGLATVSPPCGANQLFAINSSFTSTTLLPINLTTNTVGSAVCTFPFQIYDTTSLAENGSNSMVTPTFTQVNAICTGSTLTALPTTSNNNITGTWSPALNNTTTTTYTFTPASGECATTTTMSITVNPKVTPTFTQVNAICEGATLSALPTTSNNSITGTWSPALNNTTTTSYTFTPASTECANTATMSITVNPKITPTFTQVNTICEGATLSALPTTSNNSITGTWSPALNNNTTTSYTFTPASTECANTASMSITVNPKVTPTFTQVNAICEGATLSALPTTSNNSITGTWSPALNNTTTTSYTFTPASTECANTASMSITVNPNPNPTLENGSICINSNGTTSKNFILNTGLNNLQYDFEWFFNGIPQSNDNFPTFTASSIGNYSVIVTNNSTNCFSNQVSATVIASVPFTDFTIEQSSFFSDDSTITINVSGTSETLLYQLDEGIFQSSNIFTSINAGEHIVKVIDPENCTYLSKTFTIIGYPKYFTPNGDGIHDTWHVIGLNQPTSGLFIFDRFGKLIKQLKTTSGSQGWDGTYNGEKLPSTDYWFSLEYLENGQTKKLRSHFSLKR